MKNSKFIRLGLICLTFASTAMAEGLTWQGKPIVAETSGHLLGLDCAEVSADQKSCAKFQIIKLHFGREEGREELTPPFSLVQTDGILEGRGITKKIRKVIGPFFQSTYADAEPSLISDNLFSDTEEYLNLFFNPKLRPHQCVLKWTSTYGDAMPRLVGAGHTLAEAYEDLAEQCRDQPGVGNAGKCAKIYEKEAVCSVAKK